MTNKTAKLFNNGASQAVRLPSEFRFDGEEVFIRRDELSGDVILSKKAGISTWDEYLDNREDVEFPDFMDTRPINVPLFDRDAFGDDK